jgi:hypothetical protein
MVFRSSSLISALLVLLLLSSIHPALAGSGCGSNWMGDTTGDTDFYVSKNQNLPTSGAMTESSSSATAALPLGRSARADENATISSVKVDSPSPRTPGSSVVWMAEASNPGNEQMLYDFLLKGPSTGGQFRDMTGWIAEGNWTWNTTDADIGDNQIEVLVTRQGSASFEDNRTLVYVIAGTSQNNDSSATAGAIPGLPVEAQNLASSDTSPSATSISTADSGLGSSRTAPDESAQADLSIIGPNMQMPDTSPTPLAQTESEAVEYDPTAEVDSEPEVPEIMDVEGKWSIRLEDSGISLNPLRLIQTDESVMGMGTYNEGSLKLQVSADGSVGGDDMSLDVWTIRSEYGNQVDKRIKLDLVKVERTVTGSYELYSGEDLVGTGNATASKLAS